MSRLERIQKVLSDASDSDSNKGKRFKQVVAQDGYLLKGRWRPCLEITVLFCQFWQVIHQQKARAY